MSLYLGTTPIANDGSHNTANVDLSNIRLLNQDWEYLQSKGFIWRDIHGNCYKPKSIKDNHLKNILNHCKTHYRPVGQVEALQNLWYERLNKQPLNLKRK